MVVACACAQSVALLLMSRSARFPAGLANSSGELGRNFIPHITCGIAAFLEERIGALPVNDEGFLDHAYIPSFMHDRKRDYPRSFGYQFNYQNHRAAGWARSMKGMGKSFKETVKAHYPAYITFTGYMEMTPNRDSYIDLISRKRYRGGRGRALRFERCNYRRNHAAHRGGRSLTPAIPPVCCPPLTSAMRRWRCCARIRASWRWHSKLSAWSICSLLFSATRKARTTSTSSK